MIVQNFRFSHPIRVRWSEVDAQSVVFNPHYLTYADIAVTEYYRVIGMPYPAAFDVDVADLYARKTQIEYHASARFDDVLNLYVRVSRLGRSSFDFCIEVLRSEESIATIEMTYVHANLEKQKSVPLTDKFRDACVVFEKVAPEQ
ncbi:MAG: acyl-CoA thioesterase [Betaproteobacteria bacterium]|nr:acyl-CoA thioesterase [Betaproteobacteria bacterium]